jgi:hypothetical protein
MPLSGHAHRLERMAGRASRPSSPLADILGACRGQDCMHEESRPMTTDTHESPAYVMLPVATRDFILQALRSTSQQLSRTHRLRATSAILVEEGVKLTKANSFTIDQGDHLLLMQLAEKMLSRD